MMDDQRVRTVRLYGKLGAQFGRVWRLAVDSPAEAVRALCALAPGFECELMTAHDRGVAFGVFVGRRNIGADELGMPGGDDDIRIAPVISGAKSGWAQIIIGAVIIAAATYFGGPMGAQGAYSVVGTWMAGGIAGAAVGMGAAMILGGIVQVLTPTPKGIATRDGPDNGASYNFNGAVNTTAQGNPVPLLYGDLIVGSAVISGAIYAEDQG